MNSVLAARWNDIEDAKRRKVASLRTIRRVGYREPRDAAGQLKAAIPNADIALPATWSVAACTGGNCTPLHVLAGGIHAIEQRPRNMAPEGVRGPFDI